MIQIKTFIVNMLQENCYIVSDNTKEAVIIDCGAINNNEFENIKKYITEESLKIKYILNTHCHFDHLFGVIDLYQTYNILPLFHQKELPLYEGFSKQLDTFLGIEKDIVLPKVKTYLCPEKNIQFGNHSLEIIETPGHSPGGVCFYSKEENILFSGDSLFYHEIGRTDFEYGNYQELIHRLQTKILTLNPKTKVYPGHGPTTSIQEEILYNPYFK